MTGGRPSAVKPGAKLERRVSLFFAFFFYGFLAMAAWVWLDRGFRVSPADVWVPKNWMLEVGLGLGAAVILAGATPILVRRFGPAKELEREFGWILGEQRGYEIVALALLSGAAEEYFFRGAMYRATGPIVSTILFAALHWPVNWAFRVWPFFALAAGLIFAAQREITGTVVAPAITHAFVNLVNLFRITRKYRAWKE